MFARSTALVLLLACAQMASVASAEPTHGAHYVCPACGSSCDDKVFDKPGNCPVCGMKLVEQGAPEKIRPKVGILTKSLRYETVYGCTGHTYSQYHQGLGRLA